MGYQRPMVGRASAAETLGMVDPIEAALILAGLADSTYLYRCLLERRVRERRVEARLRESVRLSSVVRVQLAERRAAEFARA